MTFEAGTIECDLLVLGAGMAGGYAGGFALALAYGIEAARTAGFAP